MPLKSFSSAPAPTCSSACDGRYGTKHQKPTAQKLHCRLLSLLNLLNGPEVAMKTKMTGYPLQALKRLPISNGSGKTRVNILTWKQHPRCTESMAAGALCWNQRRCLDGALRLKAMAHTLPLKTAEVFRDCRTYCRRWELIACLRDVLLWHLTVAHNTIQTVCLLNPTISMHIWTWQRDGSFIHCII